MQKSYRAAILLTLVLVLILSACAAPVQSVPAIPGLAQTLAAQTLTARQGGSLFAATPEPPSAGSNQLAAADFAPTPLSAQAQPADLAGPAVTPEAPIVRYGENPEETCTNHAAFVEDISVPDGAAMKPGERFVKTWRFQNIGTCTWTPEYSMVYVWGFQMGAAEKKMLGATVRPEEYINISLELVAPTDPNYYQGNWMFEDTRGSRFGTGYKGRQFFWVSIAVGITAGGGGGGGRGLAGLGGKGCGGGG